MARGLPSMTALLGLLALAGDQNRDKLAKLLKSTGGANPMQKPALSKGRSRIFSAASEEPPPVVAWGCWVAAWASCWMCLAEWPGRSCRVLDQ